MFKEFATSEEILNAISPYKIGDVVISTKQLQSKNTGVFDTGSEFIVSDIKLNKYMSLLEICKEDLNDYCIAGTDILYYTLKHKDTNIICDNCKESDFRLPEEFSDYYMVNSIYSINESLPKHIVNIIPFSTLLVILCTVLLINQAETSRFYTVAETMLAISIFISGILLIISLHLYCEIDNMKRYSGIVKKEDVKHIYLVSRKTCIEKDKYLLFDNSICNTKYNTKDCIIDTVKNSGISLSVLSSKFNPDGKEMLL